MSIPCTIFKTDAGGFDIYKYDQRFFCQIQNKLKEYTPFEYNDQLIYDQIVLLTGECATDPDIFPLQLIEDWDIHKKDDVVITNLELYGDCYTDPFFYVLKNEYIKEIIKIPMQFRYHYKQLIDMKRDRINPIQTVKSTNWLSLEEIDSLHVSPLFFLFGTEARVVSSEVISKPLKRFINYL